MKLVIGDYEIDIKARNVNGLPGYTKEDAMSFLNSVSIWAHEAAEMNKLRGCYATAGTGDRASDDIYNALDARGYYKGL